MNEMKPVNPFVEKTIRATLNKKTNGDFEFLASSKQRNPKYFHGQEKFSYDLSLKKEIRGTTIYTTVYNGSSLEDVVEVALEVIEGLWEEFNRMHFEPTKKVLEKLTNQLMSRARIEGEEVPGRFRAWPDATETIKESTRGAKDIFEALESVHKIDLKEIAVKPGEDNEG